MRSTAGARKRKRLAGAFVAAFAVTATEFGRLCKGVMYLGQFADPLLA